MDNFFPREGASYSVSLDLFDAMYESIVETGMAARRSFPYDPVKEGEFAGMLTMLMFIFSEDIEQQRGLYGKVQREVMMKLAQESL
jgi:hypothetical protein